MPPERPRIGLYQPYPHTLGGLQAVVVTLARALPQHGYEPVVLSPEHGRFTQLLARENLSFLVCDPGAAWHVYGRGSRSWRYLCSPRRVIGLLKYWQKLARTLQDEQISVLHCNDYRAVMLAAPAARLAGIPVIWHMHGFVSSRLANLVAARLVNWTVPVSQGMLDYIDLPACLLGKRHIIHNGVDDISNAPPCASGKPVVLAIGTLHPRKGYETLLRAFARVAGRIKEAECRIVGGDFGDGSYGASLRALARQLGIEGRVHFAGFSSQVEQHLRECSLLAIPSRVEAFGMVALEAMRCGRPVVACRTGGLKEIIQDGQTGALVGPDDAEAMAGAMTRLLEDHHLAAAWGAAGLQRVRRCFTADKMAESFSRFYSSLFQPIPSP